MARRQEIPSLTGLRGVAVLCIVLNHYAHDLAPFSLQTAPTWLTGLFATSDFGMTLFFTLSGFVITYNYADFPWGESPLRSVSRFAWLRFSRLYPLLLLFMLMRINWQGLNLWTILHLAAVETWLPFKYGGAIPMGGEYNVSWSISVEFGLYLLFALTMIGGAALRRRGMLHWLMVAVGLYFLGLLVLIVSPEIQGQVLAHVPAPLESLTQEQAQKWFFYQSPCYRAFEFAVGSGAAVLVLRGPTWLKPGPLLHWLPVAGIVVLFVLHWQRFLGVTLIARAEATQPVMAIVCGLVMLTSRLGGPVATAVSSRPLVLCGMVSYSLYLMFNSASGLAGIHSIQQPFMPELLPWYGLRLAWGLLFAFALAWGFFRVVERPAQAALRAMIPQPKPAIGRLVNLPQAAE